MGVIKRMLRQTSRKLLSKLTPPRQSHQLVLNSPLDGAAAHHHQHQQSSKRIAASLHRKLKKKRTKSSKESAVTEALLLAAKNYLPPVQFHHVHGPNAQLSKNKFVARRTQSFCHALVFSNRVILPNERVYIKVLDIAKGWSGTIRFGFTAVDPATLAYRMPKHACPDMTNAGHTWARALADEVVKRNSVIHFSYNKNGFIHYGINNQDCGIFFANVNTKQNLWFIVDIYGLTAAVELIDPRVHNATSEIDFSQIDDELSNGGQRGVGQIPSTMFKSTSAMDDLFGRYGARQTKKQQRRRSKMTTSTSNRPAAAAAALLQWQPNENQLIPNSLAIRSFNLPHHQQQAGQQQLPNLNSLVYPCAQQNIYSPMPGDVNDGVNHSRVPPTTRTIAHDYHQIMSHQQQNNNTSSSSAAYHPIRTNNSNLVPAMSTPNLAARIPSSAVKSSHYHHNQRHHHHQQQLNNTIQTDEICHQFKSVQLCDSRPVANKSNNKSILSTASKSASNNKNATTPVAATRTRTTATTSSTSSKSRTVGSSQQQQAACSSSSSPSSSVKPKTRHSIKSQKSSQPSGSSSSSSSSSSIESPSSSNNKENNNPPSKDCPICFERPINCVLYQCGHMCTCYECGVKQWKTQSRTCPICRTIIKDVIKTYMS